MGPQMTYRLVLEHPDGWMRWLPKEALELDLKTQAGRSALALMVMKTMKKMEEAEARRAELPEERCQGAPHNHEHEDKHNCFADENEYFEMYGNATYTSCKLCGFAISAG